MPVTYNKLKWFINLTPNIILGIPRKMQKFVDKKYGHITEQPKLGIECSTSRELELRRAAVPACGRVSVREEGFCVAYVIRGLGLPARPPTVSRCRAVLSLGNICTVPMTCRWDRVGLRLSVRESELALVLLFTNCIVFHTNNRKPTFAPRCMNSIPKESIDFTFSLCKPVALPVPEHYGNSGRFFFFFF